MRSMQAQPVNTSSLVWTDQPSVIASFEQSDPTGIYLTYDQLVKADLALVAQVMLHRIAEAAGEQRALSQSAQEHVRNKLVLQHHVLMQLEPHFASCGSRLIMPRFAHGRAEVSSGVLHEVNQLALGELLNSRIWMPTWLGIHEKAQVIATLFLLFSFGITDEKQHHVTRLKQRAHPCETLDG